MQTVYEKNELVQICGDNENYYQKSVSEFFGDIDNVLPRSGDVYVYNLKFWGIAILNTLKKHGYNDVCEDVLNGGEKPNKGEFWYIISEDNGAFYRISYSTTNGKMVNIYEFLNLVPVDIDILCEDFGGAESVAMMRGIKMIRGEKTKNSTISSCAYSVWKRCFDNKSFSEIFRENDEYTEKLCRDAYFGGLCLVNCDTSDTYGPGCVLDVNSLYPYVMKNRRFPGGQPHICKGKPSEDIINSDTKTFYVKFKARFDIKPGHIPFVKTRCDNRHWGMEVLNTSDYIDPYGNRFEYVSAPGNEYVDEWGEIHEDVSPIFVDLCLYKADYELFFEQYNVKEIVYDSYIWWNTYKIFDRYVDRYYDMKKNAKTRAEKRISKLFLNALSGRMSLKVNRKSLYMNDRSYELISEVGKINDEKRRANRGKFSDTFGENVSSFSGGSKEVVLKSQSHIEVGAAITSEARAFIVRAAQRNYDNFLYSDTDSLHLSCGPDDALGVSISDELGDFKVEHEFDFAKYVGEKVYILHNEKEGTTIKAAGLPEECRRFYEDWLDKKGDEEYFCSKYGNMLYEFYDMAYHTPGSTNLELRNDLTGYCIPYSRRYIENYDNLKISEKNVYYRIDKLCDIRYNKKRR